jgi:hypothetical protein
MHLRKLLIAGSAMAAAAAFALVPVAQASTPGGNPGSVRVGANTTGTYNITGTLKSGTSVTMNIYGAPYKLGCTYGTITGTATAGSPVPNPVLRFTAMNLTCTPFIPGQTVTMSIPNTGCVTWQPSTAALVHDGLTDYGPKGAKFQEVLGALTVPTTCVVTVTVSPSCVITIAGATTSNFYEAKSSTDATQGLNLKGTGLTVRSASPLCLGAATVGSALTMNSVDFNIASPSGGIDIRDN